MSAPFEFVGFQRRDGEDMPSYLDRWNANKAQYRPWERQPQELTPPPKEQWLQYAREPGEDDD